MDGYLLCHLSGIVLVFSLVISTDLKENPKRFWAAIKSKKQESTGVAPLKNKEGFIHSDTTSKAEILNEQFQSVYTKENTSTMPDKGLLWMMCSSNLQTIDVKDTGL
jgi:hypothetical protein